MDIAKRREELEKSKLSLVQQLGVVFGQLSLLDELEQEATAPPTPEPEPPAKDEPKDDTPQA